MTHTFSVPPPSQELMAQHPGLSPKEMVAEAKKVWAAVPEEEKEKWKRVARGEEPEAEAGPAEAEAPAGEAEVETQVEAAGEADGMEETVPIA